jgi:hypothetical protein
MRFSFSSVASATVVSSVTAGTRDDEIGSVKRV